MICSLSELKVNQRGKIISINISDRAIKRHLLDMGFIKGTEVKVKRIAPTGDPVNIEIRNYEISIGRKVLRKISVEVLEK